MPLLGWCCKALQISIIALALPYPRTHIKRHVILSKIAPGIILLQGLVLLFPLGIVDYSVLGRSNQRQRNSRLELPKPVDMDQFPRYVRIKVLNNDPDAPARFLCVVAKPTNQPNTNLINLEACSDTRDRTLILTDVFNVKKVNVEKVNVGKAAGKRKFLQLLVDLENVSNLFYSCESERGAIVKDTYYVKEYRKELQVCPTRIPYLDMSCPNLSNCFQLEFDFHPSQVSGDVKSRTANQTAFRLRFFNRKNEPMYMAVTSSNEIRFNNFLPSLNNFFSKHDKNSSQIGDMFNKFNRILSRYGKSKYSHNFFKKIKGIEIEEIREFYNKYFSLFQFQAVT